MITAVAPDGVPEIEPGADLAAELLARAEVRAGDILVVTSKVVSKAEGRVVDGDRDALLPGETVRVVARRGPTTIVRNHLGLIMAAAGIDGSNVEAGRSVLLPLDPDASARRLRVAIADRTGANVGVLISDTAGRAWRMGQTDIAIGAAGVVVMEDYAGRVDAHGNQLAVTAPAVADELAGLAELASGKLGARPFVVISGRADLVLPLGDDGSGAGALIRPEGEDLFGYGAREAVLRAVSGAPEDQPIFGAAVSAEEWADALLSSGLDPSDPQHRATKAVLAFAHGWIDP